MANGSPNNLTGNLTGNPPCRLRTSGRIASVLASDDPALAIAGEKSIRTFSEPDANQLTSSINVTLVKNGDAYEIRPYGFDLGDSRTSVSLEVSVPKKSVVTIRNE